MQKSAFAALAALVSLAAEPSFATGLYTCESGDQSGWKTVSELEEKMVSEGWQVRRIKEDGGCYEAYGTTPDGERVEAYFDPVTLEMLLVARRGEILYQKQD
ncbi:PepSY domain-containing protein [Nitratireductor sp. XY-223]|uniref:PepSY domain-containing protein n=1 Tax=Nitratireductor sp. XY-223 TaxID=2561926 RepID=UPI0010AA8CB3|nr:PepSY domain-containing protein [Nitratireductor sp. XY-223]